MNDSGQGGAPGRTSHSEDGRDFTPHTHTYAPRAHNILPKATGCFRRSARVRAQMYAHFLGGGGGCAVKTKGREKQADSEMTDARVSLSESRCRPLTRKTPSFHHIAVSAENNNSNLWPG